MDPKDDFVNFVQEKPAYYSIIKSQIIMGVMAYISEGAKSITDLYEKFSSVEENDMDDVLKVLEQLRLIQKVKGTQKLIYYATDDAKILLEKYQKAKNYMLE